MSPWTQVKRRDIRGSNGKFLLILISFLVGGPKDTTGGTLRQFNVAYDRSEPGTTLFRIVTIPCVDEVARIVTSEKFAPVRSPSVYPIEDVLRCLRIMMKDCKSTADAPTADWR